MRRIGIIGAGWGGFAHLPAWRATPGVEVAAICTSREETARAAAARLGIARPFWDAAAMAADPDLDIIDCGTRPAWRLPMVLAALVAGKHVYNSCPHAPDWAGAKAIDAAWRASGRVGVVDAFSQWLPAHRLMKEMVDDGFLGRPLGGHCRFNLSLFNRPSSGFPYNWFAEAGQGVSAVRNNGSHMLFMLLHLLGPLAELVADDRQLLGEWVFENGERVTPATNDYANVILRFVSGVALSMQIGWSMTLHDGWSIDLFGEAGRLVASAPTFPTARDATLAGGRLGGSLAPITIPNRLMREDGIGIDAHGDPQPAFPMALAMRSMLAAIDGGASAAPDFARALEVERAQEAIRRSSVERRWITLAEID